MSKSEAILTALFAKVKSVAEDIDSMPRWLSEAGVDVPRTKELLRLVADYKRSTRSKPSTIKEAFAVIVERGGFLTLDQAGESWSLTDGFSLLFVDSGIYDAAQLPRLEKRHANPVSAAASVLKNVRAQRPATLTVAQVDAWAAKAVEYEGKMTGRIGGVPFDVARFEDWGVNLARIADMPMLVRIDDEIGNVHLSAPGWESVTMKLHVFGKLDAPELLEAA